MKLPTKEKFMKMNWNERLDVLSFIKKENYDHNKSPNEFILAEEIEQLADNLARNWPTCACGEKEHFLRSKAFVEYPDHVEDPVYHGLYIAGIKFFRCIYDEDYEEAKSELINIDLEAGKAINWLKLNKDQLKPEYREQFENYLKNKSNGKK